MTCDGCIQHQIGDAPLVRGVYVVARVDKTYADPPVARRGDGGVIELGLRGVDRGDVGGDRGLELVDLRLVEVDLLLRAVILLREGLGPNQVFLSGDELGLVLRLLGFGLVQRRLEQARIDLREHIALLDPLPLGEHHLSSSLPSTCEWIVTVKYACTVPRPVA